VKSRDIEVSFAIFVMDT